MSDPRRTFTSNVASIERWSLPVVEGNVIGRPIDERKAAAAAEAIARVAREQSEARGYEAGMAKAKAEMDGQVNELKAHIQRLDKLLQFMSRPLTVGKQLARRELRIDPAQVIAIIRESLQDLPTAAREARVHLHPEDASIVRERLAEPSNERAWRIVEDPTMSRGGCIVKTETSRIDARLESRINTIIANVLGDERAPERTEAPPEGSVS
jgi:flagellar assembly protein FliH